MEHKAPARAWAVGIVVALSALSEHAPLRAVATQKSLQPAEAQPVTLTLVCVDSGTIRFAISNVGATDTALPLGIVLANGRQYLISDLNLRMKGVNGEGTDYHYWPRAYPAAIAGRVDQWFQALPVHAVYSMSAKAEDFLASGRPAAFPKGVSLALRWTTSAEPPKSLLPLIYWAGTLISNSCTAP